ncbi:MAG: tRNA pseudouridine synthase A [Haliscomenobacteraceae bacterium CHB4]|nr:tRNA pseudouridine synthase A [Saprospiraceae bacterium]MCE7924377.1 tRNA pseudouridine synthase A [Haliscomenobacteraceae bacterium CHB4]
MRYFLTLSYLGSRYSGWQVQPNAPSVQTTLEAALSTILRQPVGVTGCGRTDAGVHARYYVAHFDAGGDIPPTFLRGLNSILPNDIAVYSIRTVHQDAHARYDAFERSYEYHIALRKDPFATETAWFFPQSGQAEVQKMQEVADLLPKYAVFFPFCKTDSSTEGYACTVKSALWTHSPDEYRLIFYISANRFLRGMVRLIVGACMNVALGKIDLTDVRSALETQTLLKKSLSVPPQGLFLTDVKYPY